MANSLNTVVKWSPTAGPAPETDTTPTSLDDLSGCEFCLAVWGGFAASPDERKQWTAQCSLKEALSAECSRHKPVFQWYDTYIYGASADTEVHVTVPRPGVLRLKGIYNELDDTSYKCVQKELDLVRRVGCLYHPGIVRVLDPSWTNVSVVEHWLKRCVAAHGTKCENPLKIWSARPAWVIDTFDKCLIPGERCPSYVALSYRWGRAPGLQIKAGVMSTLQRPNALNDPTISSQVAPLVRHAIELTLKIGQRYLWADTLCIDHSQHAESTEQLQLMAAIYANATLTIIGLDGDAEDGLLGLRGISSPRNGGERNPLVPFGQEKFRSHRCRPRTDSSLKYDDRGWTYQEYHMSCRRLIFKDKSLHWTCQCSEWKEGLHYGIEAEKLDSTPIAIGELTRGIPNIRSFSQLIPERYNQRTLTYDEDALPAISGMLSVLSRCFSGGFLYGISEMFFEAALSWKPNRALYKTLRRRKTSKRSNATRLHPCGLPSWSWIGWQGDVDTGLTEAGPVFPPGPQYPNGLLCEIKETIPITTWYTCSSPTAMHKRRINNWWFENREAYKDFGKPLPPGWTRHEALKSPMPKSGEGPHKEAIIQGFYPEGCGQYTFRNSSMTEEDCSWHWPFPVPDIQESTQPFMPEQTPYICCETHRVFVLGSHPDPHYACLKRDSVTLYNDTKNAIGQLYLHHLDDWDRFPEWKSGWDAAKLVELVAICLERHCENPGWGYQWDEQPWQNRVQIQTGLAKRWETYTVLWVEWKDGVAYRLASGEVNREAWEGLALEEISLILG